MILIRLNLGKRNRSGDKDSEYYLSYRPVDDATEAGYAVHSTEHSFNAQANRASLELVDDEGSRKKAETTW